MGRPVGTDIDVGARVITTQPLPEGIDAGSKGTVVGPAGWIQRRWRVEFDDGRCVSVPEYALLPHPASGRFARV
jgi:hypothetical protein